MVSSGKVLFKNLKPHIADAIKEACYSTDLRVYNIANAVRQIFTFSGVLGVENEHDLSKVIDKTIQESVALGCDLSVIIKGISLGTYRSTTFNKEDVQKIFQILIDEILKFSLKYNGDIKQAIEGLLASIIVVAKEYKLSVQEIYVVAKENIVTTAGELGIQFTDDIKASLSNSNF